MHGATVKGSLGVEHKNKLKWMWVIYVKYSTNSSENDPHGYKSVRLSLCVGLLSLPTSRAPTHRHCTAGGRNSLGGKWTAALQSGEPTLTVLRTRWWTACNIQVNRTFIWKHRRFSNTYVLLKIIPYKLHHLYILGIKKWLTGHRKVGTRVESKRLEIRDNIFIYRVKTLYHTTSSS